MTCIERFRKDYPEHDDLSPYDQGIGCPHDYGYAANTCHGFFSCANCWDQPALGVTVEEDEELDKQFEVANQMVDKMIGFYDKAHSDDLKSISKIKDSGERRQFETGAVRDIQEGKGRCDLLPLESVGGYLRDDILENIALFQAHSYTLPDHGVVYLETVLDVFSKRFDDGLTKACMEAIRTQRRCTMLLEVSKHFEEGAKKYGEWNWQKGIPTHCYIDSAVRHYLKYLRGDTDEPHDRAFVWNILCCIWTCIHKPELNDYRKAEEDVCIQN